jgi:putative polyhydroxyalkanoate system protein
MGKPVVVNIPHALGKDEARRRIESGFGNLRQQMAGSVGGMLSLQERWEGDRLNFEGEALGQKMSGRIDVLADAVRIELDLPTMLAMIAERVAGTLKKEGAKLLEKKA